MRNNSWPYLCHEFGQLKGQLATAASQVQSARGGAPSGLDGLFADLSYFGEEVTVSGCVVILEKLGKVRVGLVLELGVCSGHHLHFRTHWEACFCK